MSSVQTLGQPYQAGLGFQQIVRGTDPGAGNSFTFSLDGFARRRLVACVFTVTTSATVASRYVTVENILDDGTPFLLGAAAALTPASQTQRYAGSMFRGESEWNPGTDVLFPLLPVFLDGGLALKINVASIQAADTLTLIRLLFDRFPTSDDAIPGG